MVPAAGTSVLAAVEDPRTAAHHTAVPYIADDLVGVHRSLAAHLRVLGMVPGPGLVPVPAGTAVPQAVPESVLEVVPEGVRAAPDMAPHAVEAVAVAKSTLQLYPWHGPEDIGRYPWH